MSNSISPRSVEQASKRVRWTKQQLLDSLAQVTQQRDAALSKLTEQARDLESAKARLATALTDAEALAKPSGPNPKAIQPEKEGVCCVHLSTSDAVYKITFGGCDQRGKRWTFTKVSDLSVRTVCETDNGYLTCDCAHHQFHGQAAQPCRHKRLLKVAKQLFGTTTTVRRAPAPAVVKIPWSVINEEHEDCFAGVA